MLNNEINMSFDYLPITYGEIKDGMGGCITDKMAALLNEATENENDCVGAWNRLYNNGGNKRMHFNSILCHNANVVPTIRAGHNSMFDYENKTSISSMDIIHSQTFPEDFDFVQNTFGNINYICGMSVPPIMVKRVVDRLIDEGIYDYVDK